MRTYQERWLDTLYNSTKNLEDVRQVCAEIVADDTGGTDELTQTLAKLFLVYTERV